MQRCRNSLDAEASTMQVNMCEKNQTHKRNFYVKWLLKTDLGKIDFLLVFFHFAVIFDLEEKQSYVSINNFLFR